MTVDQTLEDIFTDAKSRFIYTPDQKAWGKDEYWASIKEIADKARDNSSYIFDDCDGFATYCVARLRYEGRPARYVFCQTETQEFHLVAESDGRILDNRQNEIQYLNKLPYKWISISGFKAGDPWHEIIKG